MHSNLKQNESVKYVTECQVAMSMFPKCFLQWLVNGLFSKIGSIKSLKRLIPKSSGNFFKIKVYKGFLDLVFCLVSN